MKRDTALIQLSREHHTALVLAKKAQQLGQGASPESVDFMSTLGRRFADELEPHFHIEETHLLKELEALSSDVHSEDIVQKARQLAQRTRHEHDALRDLAQRIARRDLSSLTPWGELLAAHVRFEERDLFSFIETVLSLQTLKRIETAILHSEAQSQSF